MAAYDPKADIANKRADDQRRADSRPSALRHPPAESRRSLRLPLRQVSTPKRTFGPAERVAIVRHRTRLTFGVINALAPLHALGQ